MALPEEPVLIDLIRRSASLWQRFGGEIGSRPLVLPNGEYFPDTFTADEASAARLVQHMQAHAGLGDIPIRTQVYDAEGPPEQASSCGSGGCGSPTLGFDTPRVVEMDDGWLLNVGDTELRHPVALTNNVARGLANIFVLETATDASDVAAPLDVTVDIAAVALGLGALLLEGAYVYTKSCGGPSVARLTALDLPELAVVLTVFAQIHRHAPRKALPLLGATQRAALGEALEWAGPQRALFETLKTEPARFAAGGFDLLQEKGLFQRFFRRPKSDEALLEQVLSGELSSRELERARLGASRSRSSSSDPGRDEIKALVAEAFDAEAE